MTYDITLFDVDGTLCDAGDSIIDSARYALNKLGINETDKAALRRFVGPPLEHAFKEYYSFDDVTTKQAVALFREKHLEDSKTLYKTYDGIPELLKNLHEARVTTAIVTSKIEHIARNALEGTGLLKYFEIIGAQQPNEVVEKAVILQRVLDRLQIDDKSRVVMIGDRKHDIQAANAHQIDSIGVLWGYGSFDEFQSENATHIAKNASEIYRIVTTR